MTATGQDGPIRVMLVDDHEVVRRGIVTAIDASAALTVTGEASSVAEATRRLPAIRPEVLVVDLQLPDGTGIDVMKRARELDPAQRMLVLTSFDDDAALRESRAAGADGLILKSARSQEIVEAIRTVHAGRAIWPTDHVDDGPDLSESDQRIVELIGDGHSNREIADALGIAEKTVKNRVTVILQAFGMQRRTQVAAMVAARRRAGWKPQ
ncbi:response regulator transcription factor [Brachybacterium saurashtrense]|uniref:DNA-binding response regulator n=2 Tax=Brachybacterium saurashtrense TaxID=556288 RepID=A0A345YN17_9MICO|nr:response regulator transcription factor [Brachybacterium saurashtrense]AXK45319.1 DNA-binding response regulator [Brachybacterium saurashtrense]RRR21924.1 DNA-binding response regulator [Brachybacterium saurashtrense]